jgi:hypothetical protein
VKRGGDCGRFPGKSVEAVVEGVLALGGCVAGFLWRRGRDTDGLVSGLASPSLAGRDLVWVRVTGAMVILPLSVCTGEKE